MKQLSLVWYRHECSRQLSLSAFCNDWVYSVCAASYSKSYRLGLRSCPAAFMNYDEQNFELR